MAYGESVSTVLRDLALAQNVEHVARVIRTVARQLIRADGVTLVLRDDDHCFYAEEDAIGPLWKGRRFPMSVCISGWVMANQTPAVIRDIYRDPRIPADAYRPTFVKSLAMVPVGRDQTLAAIGAYWATHHEASQEELEILLALADSAAIAVATPSA